MGQYRSVLAVLAVMVSIFSKQRCLLNILTITANTDQYCYLAIVVKNAFIHKEEAEVAG